MNLRRLSVSSWSLHRTLGQPQRYGPEQGEVGLTGHLPGALLKLPAQIASFGIRTLELCHFHLPSRDPSYLDQLKGALDKAGVELFSLLVDAGDITHPTQGEGDLGWIEGWVPVAERLGSRCMRVIAGKQEPTEAALRLSATRLVRIAELAEASGIRVMTENWFGLMSTPWAVAWIMNEMQGRIGLCLDFGNWQGPEKFATLAEISSFAESCHAKGRFDAAGELDRDDYGRCLGILDQVDFNGPYTLIFDAAVPGEWKGLEREAEMITPYLRSGRTSPLK